MSWPKGSKALGEVVATKHVVIEWEEDGFPNYPIRGEFASEEWVRYLTGLVETLSNGREEVKFWLGHLCGEEGIEELIKKWRKDKIV